MDAMDNEEALRLLVQRSFVTVACPMTGSR